MFVTNCISTTKIQKISEITNFFRHYFLSRTEVQNDQEKKLQKVVQRNPHVYEEKYINVNRKKDGTLYLTFNRPQFSERFTFQDFCQDAADELRIISGKSDDR